MKVLAIDTSGLVASLALADDEKIICEFTTNDRRNHSVSLMPMVEAVCKAVDLDLKTLDLIAVSSGPGSFTGLRIGSSTAKGLAHALKLPIAAVPTLFSLAHNISKTDCLICPMMDAKRQQVYTALYHYEGDTIVPIVDMMATSVKDVIDRIIETGKEVIFLGDGYTACKSEIESLMAGHTFHVASPEHFVQRAATVARIGIRFAKEGKLEDYLTHTPVYLRKPQAQREYEQKHQMPLET